MIQLKQVFKSYDSQVALDGIDLKIPEGECTVLIGPSGCGKSTLLKIINRMTSADSGEVFVDGKNANTYQPEILRRKIGYCIQSVGLFPHFSVRDNIAVVPRLLKWTKRDVEARVRLLMDISGLPLSYLDKKPYQLSGGEAQRVGVCRALAADPPVMLMDEPFGAVDPLTRERLQRAFIQIQDELRKTVVFVTHDVEEAIIMADTLVIMNEGKIINRGSPGSFTGEFEDGFTKAFLGREYPLRLLKRYTVSDLRLTPTVPGQNTRDDIFDAGNFCNSATLTEATNLKDLLSEMIRQNKTALPVLLADKGFLWVEYSDLVTHLQEVSHR